MFSAMLISPTMLSLPRGAEKRSYFQMCRQECQSTFRRSESLCSKARLIVEAQQAMVRFRPQVSRYVQQGRAGGVCEADSSMSYC